MKVHISHTDSAVIATTDDGYKTKFTPGLHERPAEHARAQAVAAARRDDPQSRSYKAHYNAIAEDLELRTT